VLTTDQKGAIAELAIARHAAELGIGVWSAHTVERYDLIFDLRPTLIRVQCKWASRYGAVIIVRCYSNRRNRDGLLRKLYSADQIDAFAAYCAETDSCYFLPIAIFDGRSAIQLRLAPARNNQRAGINWARDFEFAAKLGPHGAIAQLGERPDGIRKVAGSIPAGSISISPFGNRRHDDRVGPGDQAGGF
jgi:PD-(D/E)XK nuclease superfamily protein